MISVARADRAGVPSNAAEYRFDSVAVKEPKFEIDGMFLPPETKSPGVVYFCEVQFQKDELLYERLFGESLLYFYRNRRRFQDWQAVVIYPDRSIEQSDCFPYRSLLNSEQMHRVYLNELGDPDVLPIEVGLVLLTTVPDRKAVAAAKQVIGRVEQEAMAAERRQAIIGMVVTILVYRFTGLSRIEVEAMLDIKFQGNRSGGVGISRQQGWNRLTLTSSTARFNQVIYHWAILRSQGCHYGQHS